MTAIVTAIVSDVVIARAQRMDQRARPPRAIAAPPWRYTAPVPAYGRVGHKSPRTKGHAHRTATAKHTNPHLQHRTPAAPHPPPPTSHPDLPDLPRLPRLPDLEPPAHNPALHALTIPRSPNQPIHPNPARTPLQVPLRATCAPASAAIGRGASPHPQPILVTSAPRSAVRYNPTTSPRDSIA